MPRTAESLEVLPYWEARRQIDMQQFVNGMPFGFRDFGDGYMGGPYKGKNAYMNLEYDVSWNFLMQFLRTGDVWYLNQAQLPSILPRAFGCLRPGATEVKIRFEATGEGFHKAALYDPQGRIVATVQKFVDFEDVGRYEVQLTAPVYSPAEGWSLELYKLKVLSIEGLMPYWANDKNLFIPEQSAVKEKGKGEMGK